MKKVLIIEDEVNVRETLSDLLEIHQYEVIQACDGNEGIQIALNQMPDIIICDVNMPGKDGYGVLKSLREEKLLTFIAFIFLTAKSSMEELRHGMEQGADDYLTKPFDQQSLIRTIRIAEEKKLIQINHMNELQDQLKTERLKLRNIDHLNSHEVRRKLSVMRGLFPLIKSGEIPFEEGLKIVEESGNQIDLGVRRINEIVGDDIDAWKVEQIINLHSMHTIWLVDDDRIQNMLTRVLLKKVNPHWEIKTFNKPGEALKEIKTSRPELIFLDINMPRINGFQFLDRLDQLSTPPRVIMLSSSISYSDIHKALTYDPVVHYLTKPLQAKHIEALL